VERMSRTAQLRACRAGSVRRHDNACSAGPTPCLSSVGDRRAKAASPRMVKEALRMRPSRIMG